MKALSIGFARLHDKFLPPGGRLSRPYSRRNHQQQSYVRINGRIRAREVRVVSEEGKQLGVLAIGEALKLARRLGVDLVEISGKAVPPVCRLVNYGRFRYEQSKKEKENKKQQHVNKVKEVQLRPVIDSNDFENKKVRAIHFLCEDMKVKVILRFRGRENLHKDVGHATVRRFLDELEKWGKPDAQPRAIGRGISVMVAPLPKSERAENPHPKIKGTDHLADDDDDFDDDDHEDFDDDGAEEAANKDEKPEEFSNKAFDGLEVPAAEDEAQPAEAESSDDDKKD